MEKLFTTTVLAKRLEIHYTPKHGSWLDIAEVELLALGRQCLGGSFQPMMQGKNLNGYIRLSNKTFRCYRALEHF